jgi:hypothetical protein
MKYANGQDVMLGDRVRLGMDDGGIVVGLIGASEYAAGYSAQEWSYLKTGILIEFPSSGLIHYERPEPDVQLLARAE